MANFGEDFYTCAKCGCAKFTRNEKLVIMHDPDFLNPNDYKRFSPAIKQLEVSFLCVNCGEELIRGPRA